MMLNETIIMDMINVKVFLPSGNLRIRKDDEEEKESELQVGISA